MSRHEKEAEKIERKEIHPVSYAWKHPTNQQESELFQWWMSLRVDDKQKLYDIWHSEDFG